MSRRLALVLVLALAPAWGQWGKILQGFGGGGVTEAKAGSGLKEALQVGTGAAVAGASAQDGFYKNQAIRILLPEKLKTVERGLRLAGQGAKVDAFELSMNRAAERATPAAKAIFLEALKAMTFQDALGILRGGQTAGTEYFKSKTSARLAVAFRPTVEKAMDETGVVRQYKQLVGGLGPLSFGLDQRLDVTEYVVGKTLDGLFLLVGEEEKKIRANPAAQITPLLREVFGRR